MTKIESVGQVHIANILLVEDNEDDVFLTREAFEAGGLRVNLHHVDNGVKCLQYLRREGIYSEAPAPDLILLDMHMPMMDGHEVLAEIVKDPQLQHFPVVVLTTSGEMSDVLKMYKLRCSSYITKPVDFDSFTKLISGMSGYWLTVVKLPE